MSPKLLNLFFIVLASRSCYAGIEQNFLWGTNVILTDSSGAIFAAGSATNFPTTPGSYQTQFQPPAGNGFTGTPPYSAPFVGKFSPAGDILWGTYITGDQPRLDSITQMAFDSHGNIWVAGVTTNPRFPLTANAYSRNLGNGFLAELSSDGTQLLYSTYLDLLISGLLIDRNDDLYLIGKPSASTVGNHVVKFRPSNNAILYDTSTTSLPSFPDGPFSVITENGAVLIAGSSASFDTTTPAVYSHPSSGADIIVAGINPAGTDLLFATRIGSSGDDVVTSMARDANGNIYVAGSPGAADFPITDGAMQPEFRSGFLLKLSPDASNLLYSSFLGQNQAGGFVPQQMKVGGDGKLTMLTTSTQSDPQLTPDSFMPCRPVEIFDTPLSSKSQHWTYVRLTSDLHAIDYATATPVGGAEFSVNSGRYYTERGPFFFDASARIFTVPLQFTDKSPFFESTDESKASQTGPICVADSITQTQARLITLGLMVSILGPGIGPGTPAAFTVDPTGKVPTELAGVQVLFDGIPAPILSAAPARIDAIVPFGLHGHNSIACDLSISVQRSGQPVGSYTGCLNIYGGLRLFSVDGSGYGAVGWNPDGSPNSTDHPAGVGDILTFYGTGPGMMDPMPDDGTIGTTPRSTMLDRQFLDAMSFCEPTYYGDAPGMVEGIVQINCRIRPYPPGYNFKNGVTETDFSFFQTPAYKVYLKQ